ncbi:putative hydrolase [Streptomyces sp. HCCB10043]|nr:putative hydrolase [Streptomyces sp. HCCB10043]
MTAQAGGDVDTTCAIVGGVVASCERGAPPVGWLAQTEEPPAWLTPSLR